MKPDKANWALALVCILFILMPFASWAIEIQASEPKTAQTCSIGLEATIQKYETELDLRYKKTNKAGILPQHRSKLFKGRLPTTVLLLHGFLASPLDMQDMALALNKQGHSVISVVIDGFGGGPLLTNQTPNYIWKKSVHDIADFVQRCRGDYHIIAHSLGAGLAIELQQHIEKNSISSKLRSLTLLAPYLRPHYPLLKVVNELLKSQTDFIDLNLVDLALMFYPQYRQSLPIPPLSSESSENLLPLQAVETVLDFQENFKLFSVNSNRPPVLLLTTAADTVVDNNYVSFYLSQHYPDLTTFEFARSDKISHFFNHPNLNPHFDQMMQTISDFVLKNSQLP